MTTKQAAKRGRAIVLNCAFITGYELDAESNLDFAQARYYSKQMGRFSTVDPLMASADIENPQTWNRYTYVMNNPLAYIDPSGLIWVRTGGDTFWFSDEEWKTKSQEVDGSGNPLYRVLKESEFEFDSVDGRIRLDPNGPTDSNPAGFSTVGDNHGSGFAVMAGTAVAVSQLDSPIPGPADLAGLALLVFATYEAATHETFHTPTVLMNESAKTSSAPDAPLTPAAKKKLGNLAGRAGEKVADVIKSRGGTGANVQKAGEWAGKTLAEAATAAAAGNEGAKTAIKIAKEANRLGQRY